MTDVIIIGAGAAGLSAARTLSKLGYSILILEARDRIGGRIHTIMDEGFTIPVEAGAEFIHGDLPYTMSLMNEVKVLHREGHGRTWTVENGKLEEGDLFHDDWDTLIKKLEQLEHDMTINEFLNQYFADQKYKSLVDSVKRFVQGYDAADINKVSAKALYEEWSGENIKGYRPNGGYGQLMNFLLRESQDKDALLKISCNVKIIKWKRGRVEVITPTETFIGKHVLITVPVNLLKSREIKFDPEIPRHMEAFQQLEVGGVIKFLIEFNNPIWESKIDSPFRKMPGLNFLFSDAFVPTWWTQNPAPAPLLTGWLAGPVIQNVKQDDYSLLAKAIESLAYVFDCKVDILQSEIRAAKVVNWTTDRFSLGAYAYKTLHTSKALDIIAVPVEDTIFFAGEALYDGAEMGTVEAALASGKLTAEKIVRK
jgi:monoamine oxidase